MIDWDEVGQLVWRLLVITGLAIGMFCWGRDVGRRIADPHQCISVCEEYFEGWSC